MVRGGERPVGPADLASAQRQALQRLRRGHSVNQMKVYINQRRLANFLADHMSIPNLVEQGLRRHARLLQTNFSLSELADRPPDVKAPRRLPLPASGRTEVSDNSAIFHFSYQGKCGS